MCALKQKQALQLRYLQTLKEVANEKTNTIVFPLPLDLIKPLLDSNVLEDDD